MRDDKLSFKEGVFVMALTNLACFLILGIGLRWGYDMGSIDRDKFWENRVVDNPESVSAIVSRVKAQRAEGLINAERP